MLFDLNNIKAAIFDLDGTLLDSMEVWRRVDLEFFEAHGLTMPPDYPDAIKTMHFGQAALYTRERFSLTESTEEIIGRWNEMVYEEYARRLPLKAGAADYLRRLRHRGVKIALATASTRELYESALGRNGVLDLFDAFTSLPEVSRGKCFPDIYFRSAEKLGVTPEDCVVFEDILEAVLGAKAAGMTVVGVYDQQSEQEREEIERTADLYIEDFTRL